MVGKILIVDGVATNRIVFKVALSEAFYHPVLAADGDRCLHLAREVAPDLILLDLALPDRSGFSLLGQLRADPATREIPVLALAGPDEDDMRLLALQAGADDVLVKSVDIQSLLARVRSLLRGRESYDGLAGEAIDTAILGLAEAPTAFVGPAVISVLSDRNEAAHDWRSVLQQVMPDTILIQSREEAILDANRQAPQVVPDVYLIDAGIGGDGLRLMSELRSRPTTRHSAVCILRRSGCADGTAVAFDMGADDVVATDVPPRELALRLKTLIRHKRRDDQRRASVQDGLRLATIDPLTGLHNRRYALPHLAAIADRAAAERTGLAVMVIDLDWFKSVNDRFGHTAGDAVLVEVSRRLKANLRADDLLARIGGEEFLVALPNTNYEDACSAADRLCRAIEEDPVQLGFATNLRVTVSIGLAIRGDDCGKEPIKKIVDRADQALMLAKTEGRNKVTVSKSAA